jgi:hypothetical protein
MTAAYRTLRPSQINDAAPQLNIIMRVGGSIGTAILTVVLQSHLTKAGHSLAAQAHAFGTSFWWVFGVTAAALLPPAALILAERREVLPNASGEPQEGPRVITAEMIETG